MFRLLPGNKEITEYKGICTNKENLGPFFNFVSIFISFFKALYKFTPAKRVF